MRNPREIKSESKPEIFQNLGDGTFYYNFDIQKIRIPFQDNETSILKDGFSYKQTRFSGIPQYKVVVESVIREYLTIDEEFDLINSYNKKVKSGASDIDADVTAYKEYSRLLSSIKSQIKKDLNKYNGITSTQIEQAIVDKITEINEYDSSSTINSFTINGITLWLNKDQRANLMRGFEAQKNAGIKTVNIWYNNQPINLLVDNALNILSAVEVYAIECFNVTSTHKKQVSSLTNLDKINSFNIKAGYPDKLTFTTD